MTESEHAEQERERLQAEAGAAQEEFRDLLNAIEGIVWEADPSTFQFSFVSEQAERILGYPVERWLSEPAFWKDHLHPDDRDWAVRFCVNATAAGRNHDFEYRLIAADGRVVWVRDLVSVTMKEGRAIKMQGVIVDVTERKRAEEDARRSEKELRDLIAEMPAMAFSVRPDGSNVFASRRWKEYAGSSEETAAGSGWEATVHPDDFDVHLRKWRASLESGEPFENEVRHRSVTGEYRWFLARAVPLRDEDGRIVKWYGTLTDIEDRKQAQEAREEIEEQWRAAFESSPTMYFIVDTAGAIILVNPFGAEQLGYRVDELLARPVLDIFYEPDRAAVQNHAQECFAQSGRTMRWEARKIRKNGTMLWVRETGKAVFLKKRPVLLVVCEDITEQKSAEEALRRSEGYLAEAQRLTHTGSWPWSPVTRGTHYGSEEMFRILALDPQQGLPPTETFWERVHPEDRDGIYELMRKAAHEKTEYEHDHRIVLPDGTVKHIHAIGHPLLDAAEVVEYIGTSVDVTEQHRNREALEKALEEIKALKDQLYKENLALRDEVDRASMFEEIVGASPALQSVLAQVAKVGPTDSTVLIMGETGTGKELIARAIHKRSRRSGRAFVSVNCAALAPSLISSELFGHEKGAFTGATQRRLGRFELADGGTIFLDEVGELPPETQVALLRVLQEREFERVGGAQSVHVDVRLIAATNRDLKAATAHGNFRQDLFYRLNVFPIDMPPLRERKDDILMLVEYFVQRYARAAGKQVRSIDKKTLELFESYEWPGNIRELQNVVERSVILTSGGVLRVDESWLSTESSQVSPRVPAPRSSDGEDRGEREIIEAALAESRGRVAGPNGAAAKLGRFVKANSSSAEDGRSILTKSRISRHSRDSRNSHQRFLITSVLFQATYNWGMPCSYLERKR